MPGTRPGPRTVLLRNQGAGKSRSAAPLSFQNRAALPAPLEMSGRCPGGPDIPGTPHTPAENGNPEQFRFCQPSELHRQRPQEHGNVEIALVVCHVDIGGSRIDMGQAVDVDPDEAHPQNRPRPQPRH